MTLYGKIKSIDKTTGAGFLTPEVGSSELPFERPAMKWDSKETTASDRRLSYEEGVGKDGKACAVNIRQI